VLTDEERHLVTAGLLSVVAPMASPRQTLVAGLHEALHERLGEGEPLLLVERTLELCLEDGYTHTPPALVRLLETLLVGLDPDVERIARRLREPPPELDDPFDAVVLVSKLPFLDRQSTRTALRQFLQRTPLQPVVVVNGPAHGKTFTGDFVDHVLSSWPKVRHCRVHLEERQGGSTGPGELASDLVAIMGGNPASAPPANTNLDRWVQDLVNWALSVANTSGCSWWFVLDGFNPEELRPDTQLLIAKLAKSLTTGVARERHRLVLTDFDRTVLPLQPGLIAVETTAPIPGASVATAVRQVLSRSPVPVDPLPVVERVLRDLGDPVSDLRELGLRLTDLISSVGDPLPSGPGSP
jgi:hypothetical protein